MFDDVILWQLKRPAELNIFENIFVLLSTTSYHYKSFAIKDIKRLRCTEYRFKKEHLK